MQSTEYQLIVIPKMDIFTGLYELKKEKILLDSIRVCTLINGIFKEIINFEIKHIGDSYIVYPLEISKEYAIIYDRIVKGRKVITKAEDYPK